MNKKLCAIKRNPNDLNSPLKEKEKEGGERRSQFGGQWKVPMLGGPWNVTLLGGLWKVPLFGGPRKVPLFGGP